MSERLLDATRCAFSQLARRAREQIIEAPSFAQWTPQEDVAELRKIVDALDMTNAQLPGTSYISSTDGIMTKLKPYATRFAIWLLLSVARVMDRGAADLLESIDRLADPISVDVDIDSVELMPLTRSVIDRVLLRIDDILEYRVATALYADEAGAKVITPLAFRIATSTVPYMKQVVVRHTTGSRSELDVAFTKPFGMKPSSQLERLKSLSHANPIAGYGRCPFGGTVDLEQVMKGVQQPSNLLMAAVWEPWCVKLRIAAEGEDDVSRVPVMDSNRLYDRTSASGPFCLKSSTSDVPVFFQAETCTLLWAWNGGSPPPMLHPATLQTTTHYAEQTKSVTVNRKQSIITFSFAGVPRPVIVHAWPTSTVSSALQLAISQESAADPSSLDSWTKWEKRLRATLAGTAPAKEAIVITQNSYGDDCDIELEAHISSLTQLNTKLTVRLASDATTPYLPGVCGLSNLGNTCYLNSALQCLSNTPAFRCSMLRDPSVLGAKEGGIAFNLHRLFQSMWSGRRQTTAPSDFRAAFTRKFRRFEGYDQQDAIEFVNALLDAVLEELNPVTTKRYVERDDQRDRAHSDAENSQIYWDSYCENNVGFVFDQFYGQMRSELNCLTCGHAVCVYDAFSCIPLALESTALTSIDLSVLFMDGSRRAYQIRVRVPDSCNALELKQAIRSALKTIDTEQSKGPARVKVGDAEMPVDTQHIQVAELYSNTVTLLKPRAKVYTGGNTKFFAMVLAEAVEPEAFVALVNVIASSGKSSLQVMVKCPDRVDGADLWRRIAECLHSFVKAYGVSANGTCVIDELTYVDSRSAISNNAEEVSRSTYEPMLRLEARLADGYELRPVVSEVDGSLTRLPGPGYIPPERALPDLFEVMTTAQDMKGDNQWYCPKCKTHQDARKKDTIYRLPQYLVVQLKRFYAGADGYTMRKVDTNVPFSEELDMRPYVSEALAAEGKTRYRLFGVVHHSGSLSFGHYTASALVPSPTIPATDATDSDGDIPRSWYDFNDSSARQAYAAPQGPSAYILFFERCS
jgi:ubiquitin C-terminal hydrolase